MAANDGTPRGCLGSRALALLLLLCAPVASAAAEDPPGQVIAGAAEGFATVVATRRDELERDLAGTYALVDEYLLAYFDFETSCRLILREHWEAATPFQRQRFVDAFYRWLLASHGRALLSFRHETISVASRAPPAFGSSARVRTKLRLSDGKVYDVDFYLRRNGDGWRIVDVIAEGISYVRTFRTDFGIEIRATSLEALIERLERDSGPPDRGSPAPAREPAGARARPKANPKENGKESSGRQPHRPAPFRAPQQQRGSER